MQTTIELNGEFHRTFKIAELTHPGRPSDQTVQVRVQLIQGELSELAAGLAARSYREVLDALTDLSYVVDGTWRTFGLTESKRESDCRHLAIAGILDLRVNLHHLAELQLALAKFIYCVELMHIGDFAHRLQALQDALDAAWRRLGFMPVRYEAYCEVHRSNMSKLDVNGQPIISASGKIKKGPNFSEPDLTPFLKKLGYPCD